MEFKRLEYNEDQGQWHYVYKGDFTSGNTFGWRTISNNIKEVDASIFCNFIDNLKGDVKWKADTILKYYEEFNLIKTALLKNN